MFTSHFINILGRLKIQFIADKVLILRSLCTTQYQLYKFEIRYVLICQYKTEAYLVYLLAVDDNSQPTLLFQFVIYLWHILHYRLDTKGQRSPSSICPLHFTYILVLFEKRILLYAIFGSIFSKHTFIPCFIRISVKSICALKCLLSN